MALYLGSNNVKLNKGLRDDTSVLDSIIEGTISEYYNPFVSKVGFLAFYYCSFLTLVNLPNVTMIERYAFGYCSSLAKVNLPKVSMIQTLAFQKCSNLISLNLSRVETLESRAFDGCVALTSVNLPQVVSIGSNAFRSCYNLLSVYLLGNSIPNLAHTNVFQSTPISNYTTSTGGVYGSIYVPASLYSSYKTATNWSVYSARFVSR